MAAQLLQASPPSLKTRVLSPGPTWCMERINSLGSPRTSIRMSWHVCAAPDVIKMFKKCYMENLIVYHLLRLACKTQKYALCCYKHKSFFSFPKKQAEQ